MLKKDKEPGANYTPYDVARDDPNHKLMVRPGGMDAYKLPSRMGSELVPYRGISPLGSDVRSGEWIGQR